MKVLSAEATKIVQTAQIEGIRLRESRTEIRVRDIEDFPDDSQIQFSHAARVPDPVPTDGRLRVETAIEAKVVAESRPETDLVFVRAVFEVMYQLPSDLSPTPEAVREFANHNAVFNTWPFMREFVHAMTQRMEIPPITLPLNRPASTPVEPAAPHGPTDEGPSKTP